MGVVLATASTAQKARRAAVKAAARVRVVARS
jgi:hypothetical protein